MLPTKRRISREEFEEILTKGKRYNSTHLLLYLAQNSKNSTAKSRFSFSVSKKIAPLATNRNKIRRRGYSVIQNNIEKIKPGHLCFFSFKKGSNTIYFSVLEQEILELLSNVLMLE